MVAGVPGSHRWFSTTYRCGRLVRPPRCRCSGWGRSRSSPRQELLLLGDHNVANALAAALAASVAGVGARRARRRAPQLPRAPAPARAGAGGRRGALDQRLARRRTSPRPRWRSAPSTGRSCCCWGAATRGSRTPGWRRLLAARCRAVVAYGEAARWWSRTSRARCRWSEAGAFDEVLAEARRLAPPGDAVLLSPACSSYDMFKNYEERGARFRAAVEAHVSAPGGTAPRRAPLGDAAAHGRDARPSSSSASPTPTARSACRRRAAAARGSRCGR